MRMATGAFAATMMTPMRPRKNPLPNEPPAERFFFCPMMTQTAPQRSPQNTNIKTKDTLLRIRSGEDIDVHFRQTEGPCRAYRKDQLPG